jgi:processive 1,2-diacylglycerol beta-glucosyltransferase
MTISAYDNDTGKFLATLTEQELQCLMDNLEEETESDQDYYIDLEVIDVLKEGGASSSLLLLLTNALGDREGFEIRWERN